VFSHLFFSSSSSSSLLWRRMQCEPDNAEVALQQMRQSAALAARASHLAISGSRILH
jgi:hypothetical protein